MDWYRLKHTEDAFEAGVQDVISIPDVYTFIEWPEIAEDVLPTRHIAVKLSLINETTRYISTDN
jgi:tRNA A37 threonylcarbamoyladenosine biosynthesis protein TsaE